MRERTDAYQFTVDMQEGKAVGEGAKLLDGLRSAVAIVNRQNRGGRQVYIKLQGRLGEDNPNAYKYGRGKLYSLHQAIRLPDARRADVYIYERRR